MRRFGRIWPIGPETSARGRVSRYLLLIEKAAVATPLGLYPVLNALAFKVTEAETRNSRVYNNELAVGVVPSKV